MNASSETNRILMAFFGLAYRVLTPGTDKTQYGAHATRSPVAHKIDKISG